MFTTYIKPKCPRCNNTTDFNIFRTRIERYHYYKDTIITEDEIEDNLQLECLACNYIAKKEKFEG